MNRKSFLPRCDARPTIYAYWNTNPYHDGLLNVGLAVDKNYYIDGHTVYLDNQHRLIRRINTGAYYEAM